MTGPEITEVKVKVHIRWMIRRDLPEVLAIEAAGFDHPWCEDDFLRELRERNQIGMVAELGESVVGFMVYRLCKTRIEVLDFAVDPAFRRRGVGRQLAAKLAGKLSAHRRTAVLVDVRETNGAGLSFFRACGFRATGVLRGHFDDTGEDAYVMIYALDAEKGADGG